MIPDKKHIFEKRMQALLEKYCQQLPEKYRDIEKSWENYKKNSNNTEEKETFYRLIHTLKGTAATFGFVTQSDICYKIQCLLLTIKENNDVLDPQNRADIQDQLNELKNNINAPPQDLFSNH